MSGILGEIAAAKSLVEDLYNFVCRLKTAGVDISDLDLKLRNDRLLLLRYHSVLSQRLSLLHVHEIGHLEDYFRAVSRVLLECAKGIERYEKKGKLGKTIWCLFGDELQIQETKVAEWIGGLMSWAVVLDADQRMLAKVAQDPLQLERHREEHGHNSRQVDWFGDANTRDTGPKKLLKHASDAEASWSPGSPGPFDLHLVKDNFMGVSEGANLIGTRMRIREPIERTVWNDTVGHEAPSHTDLPLLSNQRVWHQNYTTPEQTELRFPFASEQIIGRGAYGTVRKVTINPRYYPLSFHTEPGRQYAVKCITADSEDFVKEATVLHQLKSRPHDHIVPLIHAWEKDGTGHLLFPLAQGDLRSLLMNVPRTPGKSTERWLLTQMTGIASAISSIHQQSLSHLDLKPENILLYHSEKEGGSRWMLSDFGISIMSDVKRTEDQPAAPSFSGNGQVTTTASSRRGTEIYRAPPQKRCNDDTDASADMWALGCIFLEVMAWYFQPTGYTPLAFHHSRVQTIREHGETAAENLASARFWALDSRERPILHPSVVQQLINIKDLAKCSEWLLDVSYHAERLLSIRAEARFRASELETILQHGLALKKRALGDSTSSYAILNGEVLPKADFLLDVMGDSSTITHVQQDETTRRRRVLVSNALSCEKSAEQIAQTQERPSLRKSGKWGRNEIRSEYLQR